MYIGQQSEETLSTGNVARDLIHRTELPIVVFMLLHIPLALVLRQSSLVGALHGLVVLCLGIVWARSSQGSERALYAIAYIAGAEVLWRMTGARIFWEFGKYAAVLIACVAMIKWRRFSGPLLPLIYFVLLLPSIIITITTYSLEFTRQQVSFNLSGPLALMVCAWFASHLRLTRAQLLNAFVALIAPIFGMGTLAFIGALQSSAIDFSNNSNFITSGGFGPNQVSAMLGLGATCAIWYVLDTKKRQFIQPIMIIAVLVFATQSALTFSRGGLYTAGGSIALAALFLARDNQVRIRIVLVTVAFFAFAAYVVVPGLNELTNGAFSERFSNTDPTERDSILATDLDVWRDNPVFGVGPGGASFYHGRLYLGDFIQSNKRIAAHTEYSRMLSEHGVFGFVALLIIGIMAAQNVAIQTNARDRALVVLLIVWSMLFMLESAMRILAPSLLFGLSFAAFDTQENQYDE